MVESKAWNWKDADKNRWMRPSEDAVYLAHKWKEEGVHSILDLGCGLGRHSLYFAKNGFSGTKMADLAKYIGIGQGTIYVYFKSKEDLFEAIHERISAKEDIKEMKVLWMLPVLAKQKIHMLSESILKKFTLDINYSAKVALNTQLLLGKDAYASKDTTYQSKLYQYTEKIKSNKRYIY